MRTKALEARFDSYQDPGGLGGPSLSVPTWKPVSIASKGAFFEHTVVMVVEATGDDRGVIIGARAGAASGGGDSSDMPAWSAMSL